MGKVIVGLSVSLDGFIAGADDGPGKPLGEGGEALFAWMHAGPERNRLHPYLCPPDASLPVVRGWLEDCGAMISGRRTFDIANGWKDGHPIDVPNFVVTHSPPTSGEWSPQVRFVTEGLNRALELAQEAAGDRDVSVCAANVAQQLLRAGKLDEIELSIAPVLLGAGVRLLDGVGPVALERLWTIESEGVTHLRYRVVR
jgi:dihydrofolate reductase